LAIFAQFRSEKAICFGLQVATIHKAGDLEGALAELHGEVGGTEPNRNHQRDAAQHKPLNRAEPESGQHAAD